MDLEMNIVIAIENVEQLLAGGIVAHALRGVAIKNVSFLFLNNQETLTQMSAHCGLNDFAPTTQDSQPDLMFTFSDSTAAATTRAKRKSIYFSKSTDGEIELSQDDICFVTDTTSARMLKDNKRTHIHLTGAIELEIPAFYEGKAEIEEHIKRLQQNTYIGDGLAAVRIAEILKHTLSPEPGT
ncbi:MAG: hypothetical protein GC193_01460 [Cryomorphaceae bacterium]|nr:hypothetical protein [Cryomorphaceae bacterium]